jgi:hypothetical protein
MKNKNKKYLAQQLEAGLKVTFLCSGYIYNCFWSDCNDGWCYSVYEVSSLPDDFDEKDLSEFDSFDGGLCTGSASDAIDMMLEV